MKNTCTTSATHCESCGSTDPEDVNGEDGYTACCNQLTATSRDCRGHHVAEANFQSELDAATTAAGYASRSDWLAADAAGFEAAADAISNRIYR